MAVSLESLVAQGSVALLLQEVQNGVLGASSILPQLAEAAASVGVVPNAARLAAAARAVGVPVVHCTAETLPGGFGANRNARLFAGARKAGGGLGGAGAASSQPVPEVGVGDGDVMLPRYHGLSPMTGAPLDALLRNTGVTTVVVAGVSLNVAIPNLVFDAVNRGYQVVLVRDAVVGVPRDYAEAVLDNTLSLVATLTTTDELVALWGATGFRGAEEASTASPTS